MSYWSHHPELYDEICCEGIARFLLNDHHGEQMDAICSLTNTLQEWLSTPVFRPVVDTLRSLAHKEISEIEQEYWATMTDQHKE